ncbi:uncharacterized protein LOC131843364 [Achroia grisella]|uniref:uncharacterized protein LOC131843364 n=1 Tax=Achroia grisella TaxID=688607 RepID=UPI0027D24330|nr:uncharacterized protein LOC131843364 [Achroia grisella]
MGGLWESFVKLVKYHLKRICNTSLTYEELDTLFTQIEAILNSRPLTPLSSDPNDLSPLTPGHFLIGRPISALPTSPPPLHPNRYQLIEVLRQHFWSRWRNEYLCELQQRTKWKRRQRDIQVGDLVVFKDATTPPLKWKLGRAVQLFPGSDGLCRVADFKTISGIERRALNKVCLLPTTLLGAEDVQNTEKGERG